MWELAGAHLVRPPSLDPAWPAVQMAGLRLTCLGGITPFALVRSLDISNNHLASLAGLDALPWLEYLDVSDNPVVALGVTEGSWKSLTTLHLRRTGNGATTLPRPRERARRCP